MPTVAGILLIFAGIISLIVWGIILALGGLLAALLPIGGALLLVCGAVGVIFGLFAIIGGAMAIQRKNWGLALVGSILGLLTIGFVGEATVLSLIALILLAVSRKEFT